MARLRRSRLRSGRQRCCRPPTAAPTRSPTRLARGCEEVPDEDGPGGWWIAPQPGIELPRAPEVSPDLAGWRRENLPELPPTGETFRTVPDWACEVLSPSNALYDQKTKAPFYASIGVPWLWLVDTRSRLIEVRRWSDGKWIVEGVLSEEREARMPPFEVVAVPLHRLWV